MVAHLSHLAGRLAAVDCLLVPLATFVLGFPNSFHVTPVICIPGSLVAARLPNLANLLVPQLRAFQDCWYLSRPVACSSSHSRIARCGSLVPLVQIL